MVEYEEFGTDLLPITSEEYSSCRCFSCKIIDQYNYSLSEMSKKELPCSFSPTFRFKEKKGCYDYAYMTGYCCCIVITTFDL